MATLAYKAVHITPDKTADYIINPDKIIPDDDVSRVLAYMRDGHGGNEYVHGWNGCSSTPKLAIQQFGLARAIYEQRHQGDSRRTAEAKIPIETYAKRKKMTVDEVQHKYKCVDGYVYVQKEPILAQHCFLSFPANERPTPEQLQEVTRRLMASPTLSGFYALSAAHYNTDNIHIHILICNHSADGTHTLSMKRDKIKAMRDGLDHICAEMGFSTLNPEIPVNDSPTPHSDDIDDLRRSEANVKKGIDLLEKASTGAIPPQRVFRNEPPADWLDIILYYLKKLKELLVKIIQKIETYLYTHTLSYTDR